MRMDRLVSRILDDEGLVAGLNSEGAALFVDWLLRQAEQIAAQAPSEAEAKRRIDVLCRNGRDLAQRVTTDGEEEDVLRRIMEQQGLNAARS
jgi:hypothetical protein